MKLIKFQGKFQEQLEGFPSDSDRSVEGALHLRPGRTMKVTDDEYAYIKANRPDLSKDLVVLREEKDTKLEVKTSEEKPAEVPAEGAAE